MREEILSECQMIFILQSIGKLWIIWSHFGNFILQKNWGKCKEYILICHRNNLPPISCDSPIILQNLPQKVVSEIYYPSRVKQSCLHYRPRREIYKKIAAIVIRGSKFESPPMSPSHQTPTKVREHLKSFQKVCDISKTDGPSLPSTPLSPKRMESPVTPELGRGKRSKFQTPQCCSSSNSSTSHGESKS